MKTHAVKIDAKLRDSLDTIGDDAASAEEIGYDGGWNAENSTGDPFPALAIAAEHSSRMQIGPSVAIATPPEKQPLE